ncbi:MAG: UDP-N-acetylmuramate dehydrogenase [Clostridia bacterium]|nr:UDP-N-acetylmuramate dehydrogenase [Clostridia bacterium]
MYRRISEWLKQKECKFTEFYDISGQSSIRAGCSVRLFVAPKTLVELSEIMTYLEYMGARYVIVGGMTNTLFVGTDSSVGYLYDGVAVSTKSLSSLRREGGYIYAECGTSLSSLFRFARQCGYGGYEQLSLIPGTVGGAIRGNAGAHGASVADIVAGALVLSPKDGAKRFLSRDELEFDYRTSAIKKSTDIILSALFELPRTNTTFSLSARKYFLDLRKSTQPTGEFSLGSVFKRVSGVGAGYFIDKAGLKGLSVGAATVSTKHAGFIVNRGGATGADVLQLVRMVEDRVYERFGVNLEREIEIIE